MSSRLATDAGRQIVEITTPQRGLDVGSRYRVLGDTITTSLPDQLGTFFFLGTKTGRAATTADQGSPHQWLNAQRVARS